MARGRNNFKGVLKEGVPFFRFSSEGSIDPEITTSPEKPGIVGRQFDDQRSAQGMLLQETWVYGWQDDRISG
jgi:hypothetical protein